MAGRVGCEGGLELWGTDDRKAGQVLLVMEFVEGGPVLGNASSPPHAGLPEALACRFLQDAALVWPLYPLPMHKSKVLVSEASF